MVETVYARTHTS